MPDPRDLPSCKVQLRPYTNAPEPANQDLQGPLVIPDRFVRAGLARNRKVELQCFHCGAALFSRLGISSAQNCAFMCFVLPIFTFSFYTCNVCNDYLRQKNTFGHWTALHQPASGHFIHESSMAIGDAPAHREQRPPK